MEEKRTGFILTIEEAVRPSRKAEGHPKNEGYTFLRPITQSARVGKEPSMHIDLGLNKLQSGGGIEEHFHEYNEEMPIFDHVYYIISGRIRATIGDAERIVGADTLIYCPSDVRHSITDVGKGNAKLLRMSGSGEGERMGEAVYSKTPSGDLGVHNWKLASTVKLSKMDEKRTGFIMTIAESKHKGSVQGDSGNQLYSYLRPNTSIDRIGKEASMHVALDLNKLQPGRFVEAHYGDFGPKKPTFDLIYYVISGRIQAIVGDEKRTVGADSLVYCPSNVRCSINNIGKELSKVLAISGTE
jgi:mannose-6-phosphate isomerase-like protein (cupin superfamily)